MAGELVAQAETVIAAQGGIAEGVLILFVEEIGDAGGESEAARDVVIGGQIKPGVARIARITEAQEIAVRALPREVAGEGTVESVKCASKRDRTGIGRTPRQSIAGNQARIGGVWGFKNQAVVVRVIACDKEPFCSACLDGDVRGAGAGQIGVEVVEPRFLDGLAVENTIARVAPKTLAISKREGSPGAWHDASAKTAVGFRADAEVERYTRMGEIAKVEKAALIVAVDVGLREIRDGAVFDFILVAGGGGKIPEDVGCLG